VKHKSIIVAGLLTLGVTSLLFWVYQRTIPITLGTVSRDWLAQAEYNTEGFTD
jgi:hypothetical protein